MEKTVKNNNIMRQCSDHTGAGKGGNGRQAVGKGWWCPE